MGSGRRARKNQRQMRFLPNRKRGAAGRKPRRAVCSVVLARVRCRGVRQAEGSTTKPSRASAPCSAGKRNARVVYDREAVATPALMREGCGCAENAFMTASDEAVLEPGHRHTRVMFRTRTLRRRYGPEIRPASHKPVQWGCVGERVGGSGARRQVCGKGSAWRGGGRVQRVCAVRSVCGVRRSGAVEVWWKYVGQKRRCRWWEGRVNVCGGGQCMRVCRGERW